MLRLWSAAVLLVPYLVGSISASAILRPPSAGIIHAPDTTNGSCISAPDDSCVSLVGLCVTKIATGQVGSTAFWTDPICVAAATCAGMGPVLDAACCAGTCRQPTDIGSLDYSVIYYSMVGECAFQPGGCSLTWQPFVDWFYNTIQATGTGIYPDSGDNVLSWWQGIATWTGFCAGNECADGAIPYTNFNDWFHFSSSVIATTPGTPEYVVPFPTLEENLDNLIPNILWPCLMADPGDCSWDYGPPLPGTLDGAEVAVDSRPARRSNPLALLTFAAQVLSEDDQSPFRFGRAEHQPPNVPPPVYVNGQLVHLSLNDTSSIGNDVSAHLADDALSRRSRSPPNLLRIEDLSRGNTSTAHVKRVITPEDCQTSTDTPTILPTLTYYCPKLPNICENIRSHPDWDSATDEMQLTYDPFDGGRRRRGVCDDETREDMQNEGMCDPRQHDPYYWKVSCDEFSFSASLEGGSNNAVVKAVPSAENDLQGTLQSSITNLRKTKGNAQSNWGKGSQCHSYKLKLVDNIPAGAGNTAIGSLDAGSQFFAKPETFRYVTNRRAADPIPPTFTVDTPYAATDTALSVPRIPTPFDCSPCDSDSDSDSGIDLDVLPSAKPSIPTASPEAFGIDTPSLTAPLDATAVPTKLEKRQASSCTTRPTTAPPLPTTSAEASAVAAASSSSAKAAAAAAAAALASASNPTAEQSSAAAAAVAAASALGPVAAALAAAASDASLASAIASSQSAIAAAQSALNQIRSLGPDIPDWLSQIVNEVSSAVSSVTTAVSSESNVIKPATPVPPDVDPSKDPNTNSGPPPGAPAAACFGAGSKGFLKYGDSYFLNGNGKAPATLVDVGSNAYFGLTLPDNIVLAPAGGCNGVYNWDGGDLQPDFQVDCSTMELGAYWNGAKQACYAYFTGPGLFAILCGNNIGNIYACLQGSGLYGDLQPAFINWATS